MAIRKTTPKPKTRRKATTKASGDAPLVDPKAEAKTEANVASETTNPEPADNQAQGTNEDAPAVVQGDEPEVKAPEADPVTDPEASANNEDARGDKAKVDQPEGDEGIIRRTYKGIEYRLERLDDGTFRLDGGEVFKSLTAAGKHVVSGGSGDSKVSMSGVRFWLGASASGAGSRLSPEERAAKAAAKAAEKTRIAEAKASALREKEVAALTKVVEMLEAAASAGRLTPDLVARLHAIR